MKVDSAQITSVRRAGLTLSLVTSFRIKLIDFRANMWAFRWDKHDRLREAFQVEGRIFWSWENIAKRCDLKQIVQVFPPVSGVKTLEYKMSFRL